MRLLSSRIARLQSKPKPHYQQENRFRALLSFIASYDKRATKVMNAEACKAVRQQLGRSRTDSRLTRPMQLHCNPIAARQLIGSELPESILVQELTGAG